jgi:hypothetical protein
MNFVNPFIILDSQNPKYIPNGALNIYSLLRKVNFGFISKSTQGLQQIIWRRTSRFT